MLTKRPPRYYTQTGGGITTAAAGGEAVQEEGDIEIEGEEFEIPMPDGPQAVVVKKPRMDDDSDSSYAHIDVTTVDVSLPHFSLCP